MKEVIVFEIFGILIGILIKNIHRIFPFLVKVVPEVIRETVEKVVYHEVFIDLTGLYSMIKMLVQGASMGGETVDILYLPPVYFDAIIEASETDRRMMTITERGTNDFGFQYGSHIVRIRPSDNKQFHCTHKGDGK